MSTPFRIAAAVALMTTAAASAQAQATWDPQAILHTESYVKPPAVIERIITAPRTDISFTNPSPNHQWFVRLSGYDRGDVSEYGKDHVNLGGLQIETKANRARTLTVSTKHGITLVNPATQATRTLETPKDASISAPVWSPDGTHLAFIANFDDASYLYVADAASGKSARIAKTALLATLDSLPVWSGNEALATVLVPDGRSAAPVFGNKGIASGPQVRLTESRALPQAVHPSLLETPFEKDQLRYYTTGQFAVVDVKSHSIRKIGAPAMIRTIDPSPDGKYFRVTKLSEPFSYVVPVTGFATVTELWDADGKVIVTLAKTPLREGERSDNDDAPAFGRGAQQPATDTGKRNLQWNPVGPGLVYMQSEFAAAADRPMAPAAGAPAGGRGGRGGGRGGAGAPAAAASAQRPQPSAVRYMNWLPPFGSSDTKLIYEGTGRLTNVMYGTDGKTMFVADSGAVFAVRTSDLSHHYALGRGVTLAAGGRGGFGGGGGGRGGAGADSSANAGALATRAGSAGQAAVIVSADGKSAFVAGTRAPGARWETQAPRPWVDRLDIETAKRDRLFESPVDAYDEVVSPLDDDYSKFVYMHESPTVIQDAWLRDTKAGTSVQLTHNKDVAPEVSGEIRKRLVITRPRDGLHFWTDVTLPKDWTPGTKLPGIIWFYPREYTSQANYDQSRYSTNINKYPALAPARPASSTKLWATQGYVLIEPDIPVFGDSGRMNDNYTRDLKENLDAVLDAVVDAGYVERGRMGIGGHSYGAFSTVNALTLTPYFKAGIAGDGMYNRSLTPFGFQSERRDFFQAQQTYLDMSPFYRADKISGALLMYHSIEDQNVGTAPISSERMYLALQGLGKPAALYMYPYEDHSVATYQTDLDQWARWLAWFDVYVKNPKQKIVP